MSIDLVVAFGTIVAGFVQGLSGFAFGLVAMSFWAWSIEPRLAAVLVVFGSLVGQLVAAATVRRGFDLPRLAPFVSGGLIGVPLGVWLLPRLDMAEFKLGLGLILVVWCPLMLLARRIPVVTAGGGLANGSVGLAAGVLSGLGGFSGVLPSLWCTLRGFDKDAQRSVIQNFNLSMLFVTMLSYLASGVVTRAMLPLFGIVAPLAVVMAFVGARVYLGISEASFRRVVLGLLTVSGAAMLLASVPRLIERLN